MPKPKRGNRQVMDTKSAHLLESAMKCPEIIALISVRSGSFRFNDIQNKIN